MFVLPAVGINVFSKSVAGATGGSDVGTCPSTGLTAVKTKVTYTDSSTGAATQAATNEYVYMKGAATASSTSSTSATGYSNGTNVNCGEDIYVVDGDGGTTYYYVAQAVNTGNVGVKYLDFSAKKKAAATMTISNTSTFGAATVGVASGSGAMVTDATLKVKAGSDYFGDAKQELCALFPSSNISKVSFGAAWTPIANDPSISVTTGQLMNCYERSGDLNNYASVDVPVVIQAVAGVTPVSANISFKLNDYSAYLKNGALVSGYVNGDTNADLGATVVSMTTGITVN
jgi:hypothetical protein